MLVAIYSIFVFIFLGYFARRMRMLGNRQGNILLGFLLNFALPSAIFKGVYHSSINLELVLTLLGALCCSLGCGALMYVLARKFFGCIQPVALTLAFLVTLHNTLFLGVPMVYGAVGLEASHKAILFDQLCTGLPLAILTPILMSLNGKGKFNIRAVLIRLFANPLFLSMLSGLALKFLPIEIPDDVFAPINALAACATPVALFAIGVQLNFKEVRTEWKNALLVLVFSMLITPALYLASLHILHIPISSDHQMALIELSMPPLISSAAVIARAGLNQKIAIASIVLGIALSALNVPLWKYLSCL